MSIMNPLPPQAYTKETLVQAYAWLQSQSENIKEMATTPDVLVSLFLKARLQGHGALERPSIQNFKNELKNLAGMIGEFEVVEPVAPVQAPPPSSASTFRFRSSDFKERLSEKPQIPQSPPAHQTQSHSRTQQAQNHFQAQQQAAPLPTQDAQLNFTDATYQEPPSDRAGLAQAGFDSRSLDMIQEVKFQFNLSSDTEAMRLLIATGYNQVKSLLK